MCYKKVFTFILIFAVSMVFVKGSCLEYGHSCWGAHGKRSGLASYPSKPRAHRLNDMKMLAEAPESDGEVNKQTVIMDNLDDLLGSSENAQPPDDNYKFKRMLRHQLQESLKYQKGRLQHLASKLAANGDSSGEPEPKREQWLQMPVYKMKFAGGKGNNGADDSLTRGQEDDGLLYDLN